MVAYKRLLAVSAFSFYSTFCSASADEVASPVLIRGVGTVECQTFLGHIENASHSEYLYSEWLAGYATGAALANEVFDVYPVQDGTQLIDNVYLVCSEAIAKGLVHFSLHQAAAVALERARPFWPYNSSDIVEASDGFGNSLNIYRDSIQKIQHALADHGEDIDSDGIWGLRTSDAIKNIHLQILIEEVGVPTGAFIYQLTKPRNAPQITVE